MKKKYVLIIPVTIILALAYWTFCIQEGKIGKADNGARNITLMREFEKCINTCDEELGRKLIADNAPFYTPVSDKPLKGATGYLSIVKMMRQAFPDVQWKIDDMVADDKKVAVRWTCSGTHNGTAPFYGAQPSGKKFSACVMNFYYFDENGQIYNDIAAEGLIAILRQIGAINK